MSKLLILGAAGALGQHIVRQAVSANHDVSTMTRSASALPAEIRNKVIVHEADIASMPVPVLASLFQDHDTVINTAGYVTQGSVFTDLIDHIVTSLESIPGTSKPVCWFLAGAALLDIDERGRRGVDFPAINATYWPHRVNFDRIRQTGLDWRILCPGPLADQPPVGPDRMRISLDRLPMEMPAQSRYMPEPLVLRSFMQRISEMIVSYDDAAALMLANITPDSGMSRHRVGLALPVERQAGETRQDPN